MDEESSKFPAIIELNVGGVHFTTTLLTLTKTKATMLSAMFSGNYSTVKDQDGRYFIDADGANFIHILNFLRYGVIAPQEVAETVYREAVYFGLHTLVSELEKYPCIMGTIQRNNFRNNFPGYMECIDSIILAAGSSTRDVTTDVKLVLFKKEKQPQNINFNLNHICVYNSTKGSKSFTVDAKLGPWTQKSSEKDLLNCIIFDLESKGFKVTGQYVGTCGYSCETEKCPKSFYNISFYWWKV